jgi:hypothetical protein
LDAGRRRLIASNRVFLRDAGEGRLREQLFHPAIDLI